ncbi:unnamed protein product [Danaus chrysippus]|uniref:(African queen) hypothetical protein n=1 Tax=Danaus chrysippus TaxID=151541 RepID=A0A8J2WDJ3_9NEOP|nr:unnamed protein product [Danaus chrysippus]
MGQIDEPTQQSATDQVVFNPEIVKPLPKAPPRLQTDTKRKTAVLTDTPEKDELAEEQVKKEARKDEAIRNKGKKNNNNKEKVKARKKENLKKEINEECYKKARVIVLMRVQNITA